MKTLVRILNYIRLAAFPIGYGLTGAFVGGTLNRIMLADIALPAFLVGLLFAVTDLISPVRIWLGYRSDGFPIMGRRREPYIVIGSIFAGIGVAVVVLTAVNIEPGNALLVVGGLLAFIIYGFGRNLAHNTFQALLSDTFTGDQRPRAITLYEIATLLGFVVGAQGLGAAFKEYDPGRLVTVAIGVVVISFVLAVFAAISQEPRTETTQEATEKAREIPFGKIVKDVVLADPQVRLFFMLVMFTFVGTFAQDIFLEPYGALVLGMPVGETSQLNAFWGIGIIISMLLSGLLLIKLLGYKTVLRIGLLFSAVVFVGVIIAGISGNVGLFRIMVLLMGLGTGLSGAGLYTGLIEFTTVIRAGLLMGVWGVANQLGQALGNLIGGSTVNLVQVATGGNTMLAYTAVFVVEIVMLLVALSLSTSLDVAKSHAAVEVQQVGIA